MSRLSIPQDLSGYAQKGVAQTFTATQTITPSVGESALEIIASTANTTPIINVKRPSDSLTLFSLTSDNPLNLFIGSGAGASNTNDGVVTAGLGKANTFVGYQAGQFNTTGWYNSAFGTHALNAMTTGKFNIGIGPNAGLAISTGDNNVIVGHNAVSVATAVSGTVAVGESALYATTTSYGTAVGTFALQNNTTGNYNSSFGYNSLSSVTTGSSNIGIGLGAGTGLTTGSSNLVIGTNSVCSSVSASNEAVFGSDLSPYYNIYFGKGVVNTAPVAFTINGTGGSGTDIAGGNTQLAGGKGTGNAAGGDILLQTSDAGASGTALQSLSTKVTVKVSGKVGVGATSPQAHLHIKAATEQLRAGYDNSNYFNVTVDSTGLAAFGGAGTGAGFAFPNTKFSLFGKTAIAQPAGANQAALTNSTGGAYDGTLVDVTTAAVADPSKINDNFTDVFTLLNEMRSAMVDIGLMKGAA